MTVTASAPPRRPATAMGTWALWTLPTPAIVYVLAVDAVAFGVALLPVRSDAPTSPWLHCCSLCSSCSTRRP